MKKVPLLDEKLVVKMMNKFDAQAIAYSSEKELAKPEVRARFVEQAVDETLSLKNKDHLANREAYIQAVVSRLSEEKGVKEWGRETYLKMIKGAKAAELRAPNEGEPGIKNK